jgi:hypothetical protein
MLGLVWLNVRNAAFTRFQRGSVDPVMRLGFTKEGPVPNGPGVLILAFV